MSTARSLEELNSEPRAIPSAGQDVEAPECSYIAGGNTSWYNHFGKVLGSTHQSKIHVCPMIRPFHSWVHTQHRCISVLLSTKRNIRECCVHSSFIYSGLEAETAHVYRRDNGSPAVHSHCGVYYTVMAKSPLLIHAGNFRQVDLSGATQGGRIKSSCKGRTENRGHCCNPSLLANSKPAL